MKDGRGNICPVTIILPTLAMEADCSVEKFMVLLDRKIHEAKDMLLERFEYICNQSSEAHHRCDREADRDRQAAVHDAYRTCMGWCRGSSFSRPDHQCPVNGKHFGRPCRNRCGDSPAGDRNETA